MSSEKFWARVVLVVIALIVAVLTIMLFRSKDDCCPSGSGAVPAQNQERGFAELTTATCEYRGWGILEEGIGSGRFVDKPVLDFYATFRTGNPQSRLEATNWWVHVIAEDVVILPNYDSAGCALEVGKYTTDEMLNRMFAENVVFRVPPGTEDAWMKKLKYITGAENDVEEDLGNK